MKIHLSFDYELFFGSHTGSIGKCMIEPTQHLIALASKHQIPLIFFVDAGYLFQLKHHAHEGVCRDDYQTLASQIRILSDAGHEIALHVHPHWEDCKFENGQWQINTKRYKLSDFTEEEASSIISKYHKTLIDITGKNCHSYRAGGWCVQPFPHIKQALIRNKIFADSSVYTNGFHDSIAHAYDFRNAPQKAQWQFEDDCNMEVKGGSFLEVPSTSDTIPPSFYWNLYLRMKLNPEKFKPMGDGSWLKDKGKIYKQFYSSTQHFACADGFFASRLQSILKKQEANQAERMMVLSHPKSLAMCSFDLLEEFILHAKKRGHTFTTLVPNEA